MQIIRVFVLFSILGTLLGGCASIRGAASGSPGDAWYARASNYTGKIRNVHYCPQDGDACYQAKFMSKKELAKLAKDPAQSTER